MQQQQQQQQQQQKTAKYKVTIESNGSRVVWNDTKTIVGQTSTS